jgi:predicted transcriptional regulator
MGKRRMELPPPLSEAQLEIMEIVWMQGETTVGDVWKTLGDRRAVSRNTVQTLMSRLDERGWLRHRTDGNTFFYRAAHPRQASQQQLVQNLVRSAFGGAAEGLVMTLLENGVSPEEARRIRQMIERAASEEDRTK